MDENVYRGTLLPVVVNSQPSRAALFNCRIKNRFKNDFVFLAVMTSLHLVFVFGGYLYSIRSAAFSVYLIKLLSISGQVLADVFISVVFSVAALSGFTVFGCFISVAADCLFGLLSGVFIAVLTSAGSYTSVIDVVLKLLLIAVFSFSTVLFSLNVFKSSLTAFGGVKVLILPVNLLKYFLFSSVLFAVSFFSLRLIIHYLTG